MTSIDSFISVPLIISAVFGLLLLLSLITLKLRDKARPSFIFYITVAVLIGGAVYVLLFKQLIFFVFAVITAEFLVEIFVLFKTFDNPEKREAKRAAKAALEASHSGDQDTVSAALIAEMEEKHKRTLQVHNDFVNKVSTFLSSDNSIESFLE